MKASVARTFAAIAAIGLAAPTAGLAQTGGLGGKLGGVLGNAAPGIGSAGMGNVAGLLGYCVKNNLLSGGAAGSVLGKLTGRDEVAKSPGFSLGQQGTVQSGSGQLSLDGVKGQIKTQLCNQVLKRAQSFL